MCRTPNSPCRHFTRQRTTRRALLRASLSSMLAIASPALRGQLASPADINANTQEQVRQQERERHLRERNEPAPDVRLERPTAATGPGRLPTLETPCVRIERLILKGESSDRFQWLLAAADRTADGASDPAIPRCLGSQGVNEIMRRLMNALLGRGFVTTLVLAEQQDLRSGSLTFTLIPGRIREVRVDELSDPDFELRNAVPFAAGDLLDLRDIEQALENLKRLPTAEVDIRIVPASGADAIPGESDIVIHWSREKTWRASASVDDSGTRATGKYQGSITLSIDHGLNVNDLFYLSLSHDLGGGDPGRRGTRGQTAHYAVPWQHWLFGVTASTNRYHQAVAGASQTYTYSGQSMNAELSAARVAFRSGTSKFTLVGKIWARRSRNYIDDTEVEVQRRRMAGWDLGASHHERIGPGSLDLGIDYRRGTGAMGAIPAPEEPFGEGTSRPRTVGADARIALPFGIAGQRLAYNASARAQREYTPLIPQDRFSIGGRYTVRGFDGETGLSGDRGWFVRNELVGSLGNSGQSLYAGLDHGHVGGRSAELLLGRELTGAVVGLRGGHSALQYDLFAGRPVSRPPGFRTADRVYGFYLNASY
jgi:hemolysin activation/secretion protein